MVLKEVEDSKEDNNLNMAGLNLDELKCSCVVPTLYISVYGFYTAEMLMPFFNIQAYCLIFRRCRILWSGHR